MKPIAIIAISVVCSVFAVLTILSLSSGNDFGDSIGTTLNYDCAKGWDKYISLLMRNTALEELSDNERVNLENELRKSMEEFYGNQCISTIDDWADRAEEKTILPTILKDPQMRQRHYDLEWNYNHQNP